MGRRGPPAKPTAVKLLEGNPGNRALPSGEPVVAGLVDVPKPPSWMFPDAKRHWKLIAPELMASGILSGVDLDAFAAYCNSFAKWRDMQRQMAAKDFKWMVDDRYGVPKMNPLIGAAQRAQEEWLKLAREFGLTPASRSGVDASGVGEQDDPFMALAKRAAENRSGGSGGAA